MEKKPNASAPGSGSQKDPAPVPHGMLVNLLKKLLDINFIKWGVSKDF